MQSSFRPINSSIDWQIKGPLLTGEADGNTGRAGPAGPADAVHIVLRFIGQGVVDDMTDPLDVDPTTGDIGRHQHLDLPGTKAFQTVRPLGLGHLAGEQGRQSMPFRCNRSLSLLASFFILVKTMMRSSLYFPMRL
jgi:hypothetical protein